MIAKTHIEIITADYKDPEHAQDITTLLDSYANDPMGGGKPLPPQVKRQLVATLAKLPHAFSILAYVDGNAVGLANCFEGFSTFSCKPLVNIHDFMVRDDSRGKGISQQMLVKIEEIATAKGCCKITLEVLGNNMAAQAAYRKFGFGDYQLDPDAGAALFWQKELKS